MLGQRWRSFIAKYYGYLILTCMVELNRFTWNENKIAKLFSVFTLENA